MNEFNPFYKFHELVDKERLDRMLDICVRQGETISELKSYKPEIIVLDCMGFSPNQARQARQLCDCPVLCPQSLIPRVVAELLGT